MTATYIETTVTLGDDRPEVWAITGKSPVIAVGDVRIVVHTSGQAYALIGALEQAASFLEDAELAAKASA
ncbi:hypothetical protein [Nocardioides sp.]|uniref:hypothetical protein n=1 Tax=Nocardioides sp. TaxID=35761 RepID=UPI002D173DF2|nr:hypothetical protein [Nocardioides sp.]HXH78723.1 hypothetical protein [Nocardioides sp.]